MLQLFSAGLMSLWLEQAGIPKLDLDPLVWQANPGFVLTQDGSPRPTAILQQYLKQLSSQGVDPTQQGIWFQSGSKLLLNNQGTTHLPAASLTKISTSLTALKNWGPHHQFETIISATGELQSGVLKGDLVIQGGQDPLFVWEEAIAIGNQLNKAGIREIQGNLVVVGDFWMNYEVDPIVAGQLFRQAVNQNNWSGEIQSMYATLPPGTPRPSLAITGDIKAVPQIPLTGLHPLLRHQSLPLAQVIKQMNIYSNNEIAEMLATALGGAPIIMQQVASVTGVTDREIQLINGSGLGEENQISPHMASSMLMAIQRSLSPYNLSVADVFPVMGKDGGTAQGRKMPVTTTFKTGTLNEVSALAGVLPTRDQGLVWFTIINRGTNIEGFRNHQDQLLQALSSEWGSLSTPPPTLIPKISGDVTFGSADRNILLSGSVNRG